MSTKRFFAYLSFFLVVVLTASAISTLTVRAKLLDPDLYKQAFNQSQIYAVSAKILEDNVTDALITLQKGIVENVGREEEDRTIAGNLIRFTLNTLIEQETGNLVRDFSQNIQFEQFLQSTVENGIDRDIAWLKGESQDPKVFEYIPAPEQLENLKNSTFTDLASSVTFQALGFEDLPICSSQEEVVENVRRATNGELLEITCTSEELQPLLQASVADVVPSDKVEELGAELDETIDAFELRPIINDVYNFSVILAELKQTALDLRSFVQTTKDTANLMLLFSLPLLGLGLYLIEKNRLRAFINTYLITGFVILGASMIHYLGVSNFLMYTIPFDQIQFGTDTLTNTQGLLLVASIRSIVGYILRNAVLSTFYAGLLITIVFGILLIAHEIFQRWFLPAKQSSTKKKG